MYDAYGNIYDCSETAYSTRYLGGPLHLGNIHNRGNKRKNSALATIPHMLLSGQIKQCKDCKYYPLCGGLCPLALYEKEPRCPMFIYNLNSAVFFLVRKFYMLRCLFGTLYVDMRCFGVSWFFSKHKIPHPNQWGILKPQRNTVYSRKTSE